MPTHIATWAVDDGCNGGVNASPTLVRLWVTYAESNCGSSATKALTDCQASGVAYCTAVQYLDPEKVYAHGSLPVAASAQESWWLHDPGYSDSAHRIWYSANGGANVLNQFSSAVDSWFHRYVQANYNPYNALLVDETVGSLRQEIWRSGIFTTNEIATDASLQASHELMAGSLTHKDGTPFLQIDNSLTTNTNLATSLPMLNSPSTVVGAITEDAPIYDGVLTIFFSTLLDEMAYANHTANDFIVLLSYDASGSLVARRVQAATALLGYSPGHTVSWSNLDTSSRDLTIWPEEGIVPTNPVQSMSAPGGVGCLTGQGIVCPVGGHSGLQVVPGVYRREFRSCYNLGVGFGHCAAIVNTTSAPVLVPRSSRGRSRTPWLKNIYRHEITMNGGDVQSGGTINLGGATFSAGTTAIPAGDAIIVSQ